MKWAVGRNLRIDYRWTAGNAERIRKIVAEVVALAPDCRPRRSLAVRQRSGELASNLPALYQTGGTKAARSR